MTESTFREALENTKKVGGSLLQNPFFLLNPLGAIGVQAGMTTGKKTAESPAVRETISSVAAIPSKVASGVKNAVTSVGQGIQGFTFGTMNRVILIGGIAVVGLIVANRIVGKVAK